jgi:hypothetical protein
MSATSIPATTPLYGAADAMGSERSGQRVSLLVWLDPPSRRVTRVPAWRSPVAGGREAQLLCDLRDAFEPCL